MSLASMASSFHGESRGVRFRLGLFDGSPAIASCCFALTKSTPRLCRYSRAQGSFAQGCDSLSPLSQHSVVAIVTVHC